MTTDIRHKRILHSPRVMLRERDCQLTYPTISRIGDKTRTGRKSSYFDDTLTIVFETAPSGSVHYPTLLPTGSRYLSSQVTRDAIDRMNVDPRTRVGMWLGQPASGSDSSHTASVGRVVRGISDEYLRDLPESPIVDQGEDMGAFKEVNLFESEANTRRDPWWLTGSAPADVGFGLSQPVWAKAKIEIDMPVVAETQIGCLEIAYPEYGPERKMSIHPMAYYSFNSKTWEPLGSGAYAAGFETESEDPPKYSAHMQNFVERAPIGFSPGSGMSISGTHIACRPISTFGFPYHEKFHATSSQCVSLSGVLDRPFAFEKYVLEQTVSVSSSGATLSGTENSLTIEMMMENNSGYLYGMCSTISSFFILHQYHGYSGSYVSRYKSTGVPSGTLVSTIPTHHVLSEYGSPVFVDTMRDFVTYGQLTVISGSTLGDFSTFYTPKSFVLSKSNASLVRELVLDVSNKSNPGTPAATFGISDIHLQLSGCVKYANQFVDAQPYRLPLVYAGSMYDTYIRINNLPGGRHSCNNISTNRDLVSGQCANTIMAGYNITVYDTSVTITDITDASNVDIISPYVLMPNDELVFGWQSALGKNAALYLTESALRTSGNLCQNSIMKFCPGHGKLTLYGSVLCDASEIHDTLNQPLASDAIHEVIKTDVYDEWDTESVFMMHSRSQGLPDSRARRMSVAEDISERYYDTLLPPAYDVTWTLSKPGTVSCSLGWAYGGAIGGSTHASASAVPAIALDDWSWRFPFEPTFSSVQRTAGIKSPAHEKMVGWCSKAGVVVNSLKHYLMSGSMHLYVSGNLLYGSASSDRNGISVHADTTTVAGQLPESTLIKMFYGFGTMHCADAYLADGKRDRYNFAYPYNTNVRYKTRAQLIGPASTYVTGGLLSKFVDPVPHGWKYGILNGFDERSRAIWRRDRYGQFRDMLEQRQDAKFYDTGERVIRAEQLPASIGEGPVTVRFVQRYTNVNVDPYSTTCSNVSTEATASIPYIDGKFTNRESTYSGSN